MKFKKPSREWETRFAWFPVRMTDGEYDKGRLVWLETYWICFGLNYGVEALMIISGDDRVRHLRDKNRQVQTND